MNDIDINVTAMELLMDGEIAIKRGVYKDFKEFFNKQVEAIADSIGSEASEAEVKVSDEVTGIVDTECNVLNMLLGSMSKPFNSRFVIKVKIGDGDTQTCIMHKTTGLVIRLMDTVCEVIDTLREEGDKLGASPCFMTIDNSKYEEAMLEAVESITGLVDNLKGSRKSESMTEFTVDDIEERVKGKIIVPDIEGYA